MGLLAYVCFVRSGPLGAGLPLTVFAAAGTALVIGRHRANIRRLLRGRELHVNEAKPPADEQQNDESHPPE